MASATKTQRTVESRKPHNRNASEMTNQTMDRSEDLRDGYIHYWLSQNAVLEEA